MVFLPNFIACVNRKHELVICIFTAGEFLLAKGFSQLPDWLFYPRCVVQPAANGLLQRRAASTAHLRQCFSYIWYQLTQTALCLPQQSAALIQVSVTLVHYVMEVESATVHLTCSQLEN